MFEYAQPLHDLIEELRRIPGVGAKTAQRMAFHFLNMPVEDTERLADAIREARKRIFSCSVCNNITHVDPCEVCSDAHRQDDVDMLQDLVLAALTDAAAKVDARTEERLGALGANLKIPGMF